MMHAMYHCDKGHSKEMSIMMRRMIVLWAMAVAVTACGIDEVFMVGLWDGSEIMGSAPWYLVELNGNPVENVTVTVQYENNNLAGYGFCNWYRVAPYHTSSTAIHIDDVATMNTTCTDERMTYEQAYVEALRATTQITVHDGKLLFQSDQGQTLLMFMQ
jgi:heat shock protein HslJ